MDCRVQVIRPLLPNYRVELRQDAAHRFLMSRGRAAHAER